MRESTPKEINLKFYLWTREAVRLAIKKKFSINLPVRTVTDYLQRWGCCPIKPIKAVRDAKPKAYRSWLEHKYPKLISNAKKGGFEIHWCDTNKVSTESDISIISSISNQGEVRFLLYQGKLSEDFFDDFLYRLKKEAADEIWLIMYRKEVFPKAHLGALGNKVKMHYLKAYQAT